MVPGTITIIVQAIFSGKHPRIRMKLLDIYTTKYIIVIIPLLLSFEYIYVLQLVDNNLKFHTVFEILTLSASEIYR